MPAAAIGQEVIDNGTVQIGINPAGNLVTGGIGLNFLGLTGGGSGEALAPGCACEGWGVADMATGEYAKAGASFGYTNIASSSVTASGAGTDAASTGNAAVSVVSVSDGTFSMDITHSFAPSASDNLYQVDLELTNTGVAIGDLVYRRAMDWDVPPTEFSEYVTIQGWPAARLRASSDDGFADGNPNVPLSTRAPDAVLNGNFTDSGPADHGAAFDFALGALAPGDSENVKIFYGAAASEADAMLALSAVGAEVYSLGQPSSPGGETTGEPNTFIFGFAGVGGTPVGPGGGGASSLSAGAAADVAFLTMNHHLDVSTRRFNRLMLGASAGDGEMVARNFAAGPGGAPGARTSPWNLELAIQGTQGSTDPTTNNVGFDFNARYIGASLDYALPRNQMFEQTIVGAALGYEEVNANFDAGVGNADGHERSISFYAAGINDEGFFGDVNIMLGDLDYDLNRVGLLNVYSADVDGERRAGRLRLGYNFDAAQIGGAQLPGSLGVYAEVTRARVEFDTFTENNGGLTTQGFSDDQNILALGARYAFTGAAQEGRQFGYIDLAAMVDTMADDFSVTQTTAGGATMQTRIDGRDGLMGRLEVSYGFQSDSGWYGSMDIGSVFGDGLSEGSLGVRVGLDF
ncbi:autotransporter outer membrane beta-barrel domain-containing protein [Roseovarius spongiae]|nr:autotransporter outer membrane beta-barrel domain-containing protein [Roseovarius spongiae]